MQPVLQGSQVVLRRLQSERAVPASQSLATHAIDLAAKEAATATALAADSRSKHSCVSLIKRLGHGPAPPCGAGSPGGA